MIAKLCAVCGADLAHRRRSDHRYCSVRCRVRAHRIRAAVGIREARRQRRTDRRDKAESARKAELAQEREQRQKLAATVERLSNRLDTAREDHDSDVDKLELTIATLKRRLSNLPTEEEVAELIRHLRAANQRISELKRASEVAPAGPDLGVLQSLKRELSVTKDKLAKLERLPQREAELAAEVDRLQSELRQSRTRETDLRAENESVRRRERLAVDEAAHEKEMRLSQGGWIKAAEIIGLGLLGGAARKQAEKAATTGKADPTAPASPTEEQSPTPPSPKPQPPATTKPDWEQRIATAQRQGWLTRFDRLVSALREELEQSDNLATWQQMKGRPITGQALPPSADTHKMATRAALEARWKYQENPPPNRRRRVDWIRKHYLLDSESESALQQEVRERIEKVKAQMRG